MPKLEEESKHFFHEPVIPVNIGPNLSVRELVDSMGSAQAFNAGRLYEAARLFEEMVKDDALICVTMAGALAPSGMGGPLSMMIKNGLIDFLVSTGANIYHDAHMALGYPFYKGDFKADDVALRRHGLDRVYDVWVKEKDLIALDDFLVYEVFPDIAQSLSNPSTAEFHYALGKYITGRAKHPNNSVVVQAYLHKVPIFCPSPGDSSIGMDLAQYNYLNPERPIKIDVDKDVMQSTALTFAAEKSGGVILGGGSPKNFYLQTQPMLSQILRLMDRGHDYIIQFTVDVPQYGGLSGATPHEAISWGKIKPERANRLVTVYGDVTISLCLLAGYVSRLSRKPKKLMDRLQEAESELVKLMREKSRG